MSVGTESFVKSIIDAHGGLATYERLSKIETRFDITGAILRLKGRPHQHLTATASISTKEQKVAYTGVGGGPDEQWVFTPQKVYKQRISDQAILSERDNPREAFANHDRSTAWDDLHLTYFLGYAIWQYFNFPYLLARKDVVSRELEPHHEAGQAWRVLEVTFPDPFVFATHGKVQSYYFNDKFILQRHDYSADVVGGGQAAHYSYDPVLVGGMTFLTLRRVVARMSVPNADGSGSGSTVIPLIHGPAPTAVHLVIYSIELKNENHQSQNDDSNYPSPTKQWSLKSSKI